MDTMAHNMTTVYGDGEDGGELILADLIKFKRYSVVVQAFNEVGNGPLSEPTTAQTMEDGILYVSQLLLILEAKFLHWEVFSLCVSCAY